MRILLAAALLLAAGPAAADVVLRMGVIAPEGTAWARELKAFARDVESSTGGQVRIKWYMGGIAGDELTAIGRIRKGQLDGTAVSVACSQVAPSLRVTRVPGLFQRYDESHFILNQLRQVVDQEARKQGFVNLGTAVIGSEIIFSRRPVQSMADWRSQRFWVWNLDDLWLDMMPRFKLKTVSLPVEEAGAAFDQGKVDGFLGIPTAALAYQWSTRAHYFTRLRLGFLPACLLVTTLAFDALPIDAQNSLRAAGAKLGKRFDDINRVQEEQLLGGLLQRQGGHDVPLDNPQGEQFRADFFEQAHGVRDQIADGLVPRALLERVTVWLADFRAEHR